MSVEPEHKFQAPTPPSIIAWAPVPQPWRWNATGTSCEFRLRKLWRWGIPRFYFWGKTWFGPRDKPSITNPYSRNFVQFLFHSNHCLWRLRVNICNAWFSSRFCFKCSQNNICSHNLKLRSESEICGGNFRQMASNRTW